MKCSPTVFDFALNQLSLPDAAKYMGCTVWFVKILIWSRQVPVVKSGKRFLFDRRDLDGFIDSQKNFK
jgi:excisionase family DNA binding protein